MKDVQMDKAALLEILKKNRDAHRAIVEEAWAGYRTEVIKLLDQQLAAAKAGKKQDFAVYLQIPQDHTTDYDAEISMLDADQRDFVHLGPDEYRCFVLDQWHWLNQFLTSNSTYSSTAVRRMASR